MTHSRPRSTAFTLVEILAAMGIMIVLAALIITVVSKLPGSADRAKCSANLRNLYLALDTYTQEQMKWPQQPDFGITQQIQYEDWWMRTLAPYGMTPNTWQCPAILRLGKIQENRTSPRVHYSPTMFDADPRTPYRWSTQPWAIEIANVHGRGALMIFPDGSVRDLDDVIAESQKDNPSQ
jgi:type II secretory pathway pseudopilin PulG